MARVPFLSNRGGGTAVDPVCNMDVDMKKPNGGTYDYKGETYYVACEKCKKEFEDHAEKYIAAQKNRE